MEISIETNKTMTITTCQATPITIDGKPLEEADNLCIYGRARLHQEEEWIPECWFNL